MSDWGPVNQAFIAWYYGACYGAHYLANNSAHYGAHYEEQYRENYGAYYGAIYGAIYRAHYWAHGENQTIGYIKGHSLNAALPLSLDITPS